MRSKLTTVLLALISFSHTFSQKLPVIRANTPKAGIRLDGKMSGDTWTISPHLRPDVYDLYTTGKPVQATFITDRDSISFGVKPGDYYEFVVLLNEKDSALTAIKGSLETPRAKFSEAYQNEHRGKTFVEIPAVYELINVVFAITKEGRKNNGLVRRNTAYHREVMQWFDKFGDDPVVEKINAELKHGAYHAIKMDAYAFYFQDDKLVPSKVYNRLGLDPHNHLTPFIKDLEAFANRSGFNEFYQKHEAFYKNLIAEYRRTIDVTAMQTWLNTNFPSTRYDCFKIIFSMLVSANQSATWFNDDGFAEAQAHVVFPGIPSSRLKFASREAVYTEAGNIVFTELNHAFIGPESKKYENKIKQAFADLSVWNNPGKPAKYYDNPMSSFDEYMNWGLVNLRYVDLVPAGEQAKMISAIEKMMKKNRGFRKFPEFSQFLVAQYRNRKPGQTVADLYPAIVDWFAKNK